MRGSTVYLDHNATSPLLPEALEAMQPWLRTPANPSSVHAPGRRAAAAVERAAAHVAALVGCGPERVVFTSGATEANHLWAHAVGVYGRAQRVAVGATEHPSVHAAFPQATRLAVDRDGTWRGPFAAELDGVSLMAANHETGVKGPLEGLRARAGWVHVDATAAAGRMPLALDWVDAITLSAHKIGGPMGIGALIADDPDLPAVYPGSQQRGRRAGTLNTPAIVGFGEAARLAAARMDARVDRWLRLRERVVRAVSALGGRALGVDTVPTVVNAVFAGLPAELLAQALDLRGVAVSAGSACASGSVGPSPVLEAMGEPEPDGGLRISMGWSTTDADIDALLDALPPVVDAARAVS